jgi:hypothetical protein
MPLPKPQPSKTRDDFVDRCMGDDTAVAEYPDAEQRAVKQYREVPASACVMTVGEFVAGDNGEGAKSAPVRLKARSGQPIEHWYWGNVVHDLSGMKMAKSRLAIDYVHDPKEIIGYLNRFDDSSGDLIAEGALVPYKDSDRASEIIHKMAQGVPYEASINFAGDGIKVQELASGEVVEVNGYQLEGPAVVIREWPLRGVAICPYGADQNTESNTFDSGKLIKASVFSAPIEKEESEMDDTNNAAEEVEPKPEALSEVTESVEAEPAEPSSSDEGVEAVEVQAEDEGKSEEIADEVVADPVDTPADNARAEFARMKADFGPEVAAEVFERGGNYADALKLAFERIKSERDELAAKIAESKGGSAAAFSPKDDRKAKSFSDLFKK